MIFDALNEIDRISSNWTISLQTYKIIEWSEWLIQEYETDFPDPNIIGRVIQLSMLAIDMSSKVEDPRILDWRIGKNPYKFIEVECDGTHFVGSEKTALKTRMKRIANAANAEIEIDIAINPTFKFIWKLPKIDE